MSIVYRRELAFIKCKYPRYFPFKAVHGPFVHGPVVHGPVSRPAGSFLTGIYMYEQIWTEYYFVWWQSLSDCNGFFQTRRHLSLLYKYSKLYIYSPIIKYAFLLTQYLYSHNGHRINVILYPPGHKFLRTDRYFRSGWVIRSTTFSPVARQLLVFATYDIYGKFS